MYRGISKSAQNPRFKTLATTFFHNWDSSMSNHKPHRQGDETISAQSSRQAKVSLIERVLAITRLLISLITPAKFLPRWRFLRALWVSVPHGYLDQKKSCPCLALYL